MQLIPVIFGIGLLVVATLIGVISVVSSARSARGPLERGFLLRATVGCWLVMLVALGAAYYLPSPYRYLAFGLGAALVPIMTYRAAKRRQLIRILEEQRQAANGDASEARR
jgi:hypothetical protein